MDEIIYQKELGPNSYFETEAQRLEYAWHTLKEVEEAFHRFLTRKTDLLENYHLFMEYTEAVVQLSTKFYCPFYIKYRSDVNRFCFGIRLDYVHIDPFEGKEWQKIFATHSVEIEAESEDAFCLEYSVEAKESCCFIVVPD